MDGSSWALLLRPLAALILWAVIIAPVSWLLFKMFPSGRLKVFLFKVRDGPEATRRDKMIHRIAAISALVAFCGGIVLYMKFLGLH